MVEAVAGRVAEALAGCIHETLVGGDSSLAVLAVLFQLQRSFSVKISNRTGKALWIWKETRLSRGEPVAFFATRNFVLPKTRAFVKIKVSADPQYTLYFNGREIGGAAENGSTLDVYDVSDLALDGVNRIVVAVRSANGVGGLLATVDVSPNVEDAGSSRTTAGPSTTSGLKDCSSTIHAPFLRSPR